MPYIIKIVGFHNFGLLALATTAIAYVNIIVDFGFSLTATRDISLNRRDVKEVSTIVSSVIIIKTTLLLVCALIMGVLIYSVKIFNDHWQLYALTFLFAISQTFFPIWFFQGIEKMKYITYLNIFSKIIFTASIFFVIKTETDYLLVPVLNFAGSFFATLLAYLLIRRELKISFVIPSKQILISHFRKSWRIFVANASGNLYSLGSVFVLGFFATPTVVGYYSLAEKLGKAFASIFQPVAQAIYPYLVEMNKNSHEAFVAFYKNIFKYVLGANLLLASIVLYFSSDIYILFSKTYSEIGQTSFVSWIIISFFTIFSIILFPFVLTLNQDKKLMKIYVISGLGFVAISPILAYYFSYIGILATMACIELFILSNIFITIQQSLKNHESRQQ